MKRARTILVLDNDPPRHDLFRAAVPEFQLVHTYEVLTFAEAVQEDAPDLISLDHDLTSGANVGRQVEECGCDAAEIVVRLAPSEIPVLIHSANALSAQVMRRILVKGGRVGRVARINIAAVTEHGEKAGIEVIRGAIQELLASPRWPEDLSTDELLEMLGDDPRLVCATRAARR